MTGRTSGARPTEPAKPAKKAAPKPPRAKAEPAATVQDTVEPPPEGPGAHRAGGWIDRGDGRGWELEEE